MHTHMQTFMLTCTQTGAARRNADRSRRSSPAFRQAALPGLGFVPGQQMPAHRSGTIPHCCRRRFRSHGRPTHLWGKVHLVSTGVCRWDSARRLRCCWRCAIHTCMRVSTLARPTATHATALLRETPRLCAQETHANAERGKRQDRAAPAGAAAVEEALLTAGCRLYRAAGRVSVRAALHSRPLRLY